MRLNVTTSAAGIAAAVPLCSSSDAVFGGAGVGAPIPGSDRGSSMPWLLPVIVSAVALLVLVAAACLLFCVLRCALPSCWFAARLSALNGYA